MQTCSRIHQHPDRFRGGRLCAGGLRLLMAGPLILALAGCDGGPVSIRISFGPGGGPALAGGPLLPPLPPPGGLPAAPPANQALQSPLLTGFGPTPPTVMPPAGSPATGPFTFPVQGRANFSNDYGVGTHAFGGSSVYNVGIDIFATTGTPIVAPVSGTLHTIGQNGKGGNRCHIRTPEGTDYYFAHMSAFAPGLQEGLQVAQGSVLGSVGDTGNAKGTPPHLHFAAVKDDQPWNPYEILVQSQRTAPATPT